MGNFDLFDLIDVSFDPPEPNAKKVLNAIEKSDKELNGALGGESVDAKRNELNAKLQFLQGIRADIFESNGAKLTKKFKDLAKTRTDAEIKKFKASVELVAQSGRKIVTKGKIKQLKKSGAKLSADAIEKVYRDVGFEIQEAKKTAKPDFPSNADKIYDLLTNIRMFPEFQKAYPNAPNNANVDDLYGLIAFLEDEPENAAHFRGMLTDELETILDRHAIKRAKAAATKQDPLGQAFKDIITLAKKNVFDSDANRAKYGKHLLYKKPEMVSLFDKLKTAKNLVDLEDPEHAEPVIKQIAAVFGTRDEAIALYNYEANVAYEDVAPIFYVKCAHCQNLSEFVTEEEAKRKNACTNCGKALYKICSNCSQKVLDSLDKCPNSSCGFLFAGIVMFQRYVTLAENALLQANFNEARKYLSQAKTANPSEKTKTGDLAARIDNEEAIYEKPIAELRTLISEKKFVAAEEALSRTIASFPKLNIASYETQIKATLEKARYAFTLAQKRSQVECANACIDILDICQDFKPALEFLRTTPPEPVKSVTSSTNVIDGWASLNWAGTGEKGVTYCIVRKDGKTFPKNELDGTHIKDNLSETVYRDESVPPGTWYSYGVFAKREGICSSATGTTVLLLAEVKDVRHEQIQESLRITWTMPKNCIGVSVSRTDPSGEVILAENAQTSYEDKRVSYGNTYSYILKANYAGHASSNGTCISVRFDHVVEDFSISARQVKGNSYTVSWDIPNKGIDVRILVGGKIVREAKSDAKRCDIELPANGYHVVEVSAFSQGRWVTSQNNIEINTYLPHKIDRSRTQVQEREVASVANSYAVSISVSLQEPMPGNVKGFYYTVRTKSLGTQSPPWAEVREVEKKTSGIVYKDISDYRTNKKISCGVTVKEEDVFYLSLFTNYVVNGKDIISAPEKIRISRPIVGDILWSVRKPLLGGQTKLCIDVKANQPIDQQPKLILCACGENEFLTSVNDPRAVRISEFEEQVFEPPQSAYIKEYAINASLSKKQKLFLFCENQDENQSFTTKWAKGFSGKL